MCSLTFIEDEETDKPENKLQLQVLRGRIGLFIGDVWYH
jgi:hypothetical protein